MRHIGTRLVEAAIGALEPRLLRLVEATVGSLELRLRLRRRLKLRLLRSRLKIGPVIARLRGLKARAAFIELALCALGATTLFLRKRRTGDQRHRRQQTDKKRLTHHVLQTRIDPKGRFRR